MSPPSTLSLLHKIDAFLVLPSSDIEIANQWLNDDIKPLPPHRRTWNTGSYVFFWALNNVCIYSLTTGSALVAIGLSVWQAMIAIILARIIITAVAVTNGWVGAEWHIGFAVISRYVWGMYGSYVQLAQRIMLSAVWMAVQSWTGGLCISVILSSLFPAYQNMKNTMPASAHMETKQFIGWVIFNVVMAGFLRTPVEKARTALVVFSAVSFLAMIAVMSWAVNAAGGAGPLLSAGSTLKTSSQYGWGIVQGVTSVIGSIAVGLTNQPDYSRFAKRPGDQVLGQVISIPLFGTLAPLLGCLMASATQSVFGKVIWLPPVVAEQILVRNYTSHARAGCFFLGVALVVSQVAINSVDNAWSGGMDLAGLTPRYLNIRRGAYLTLLISILLQPWQLLSTASTFLTVLGAYSVFLGPMSGIMICHYWFVAKRRIKLSDLYRPDDSSIYWYLHGFNWRAFGSWACGFLPLLPGFIHNVRPSVGVSQSAVRLFYLAYPAGFVLSGLVYYVVNRIFPPVGLGIVDDLDSFGTFTEEEALRMGVKSRSNTSSKDQVDRGRTVLIIPGLLDSLSAGGSSHKA